jgi:hypothetical protein
VPPAKPKTYPTPYNRKQQKEIEAEKLWDEFNPRYDLYQEVWTFNVSQAYDLIEAAAQRHVHEVNPAEEGDSRRAFSYLLAKSDFNLDDKFSHRFEYRYYPALVLRPQNTTEQVFHDQQLFNTSLTWYWKKLANLRRTRFFERSITASLTLNDQPNPARNIGGYITWSFNDFASVQLHEAWDLTAHQQTEWSAAAMVTHPSECWGLAFHWDWQRSRDPSGQVGFQVLLNLDGSGFLGKGMGSSQGQGTFFNGT